MKHKKILIFMGSPRAKGNSSALAEEAARGATKAGAEVEVIRLAKLKIGPCLACEGCRKPDADGCVRKDDMLPLYDKLRAADAVIIAGPVYWFSISSQVKTFMDRFYAFGAEGYRPLKGKRVGIHPDLRRRRSIRLGGRERPPDVPGRLRLRRRLDQGDGLWMRRQGRRGPDE